MFDFVIEGAGLDCCFCTEPDLGECLDWVTCHELISIQWLLAVYIIDKKRSESVDGQILTTLEVNLCQISLF